MIDSIIAFSVKNKLLIVLLTVGLIGGGIWSLTQVPIDAVPDITNNQVQIITQAPSLAPEEIEQFVTYPVELAMANLPKVTEIRSISRFGLSLVTVVFEDNMGTYLPRQLVAEKLDQIRNDIPEGFGQPYLGPISTGLGEIYQYTLEVDSAYRGTYSSSDLRTIQDWYIRRQMAMVPGVIEINAFGGNVKQYEVAVDPHELKAIGLTISEVFTALENNNQNSGGAYIEKDHKANFIRGEGLIRNLEDIEHIVIKTVNGLPITINDVAEVRFGRSVRYGAVTKNGQGETVGGLIMMLKGANSYKVIKTVKARMAEIEGTLPPGITIKPFLDRRDLISRTTRTVNTNLIEGALIVIFVLVFLLGNWRGGLIVASTIPLSLLFAFILMNIFDVWANLMSLGAIDFGIIVDGAVIIVEGTVFVIHQKIRKGMVIDQEERDETTRESSSKMMHSAFFGQLIILIVFIPILSLQGIEGKMFKPMALTFMFAMIGVMLLCLTYVPAMTAWFLRVNPKAKPSWGDRLVTWLENGYEKRIKTAFRRQTWIMAGSVLLLGGAVFIFTRLGGEFIPKLDEGDLVFHIILKPGSSLSESIEASTKIEAHLLTTFPEIEQVLSKFGVSEVPTDPMPMEVGDCFVILKPKSEWVSAGSKPELIDKIESELARFPGLHFEFSQPIEMRFNELMTGVREDIAIKLFGEDLDILATKAEEIGDIVSDIPGVADLRVEATLGLPQMTIRYDRYKLAQYGLDIRSLNRLVETAFSGTSAGVIFEGEKRFDLVVRLQEEHRTRIEDVRNLFVPLPEGSQVPLKEVAQIEFVSGPMQISRDNTNRRTYVGINVRGRDIQSLVDEIRQRLDAELTLPPGYAIRYGGAFENLERATNRLKIVVPASLGLIFIMIFFALRSFRQTVMIYFAIPFAAIGGVLSLWIRGMPFSISAGIGFVVLFGVAVLNGLVLISSWNELKEEGETDLDDRIIKGARRRIRPILLTASTDILGFLPMAISTSAGAEVQRPLATVVIGGMITATLLTLFVLPLLYRWLETKKTMLNPVKTAAVPAAILALLVLCGPSLSAQEDQMVISSLEEAIDIGLRNNGNTRVARTDVEIAGLGKKQAINIDKTELGFDYGQYNSAENEWLVNITQSFAFPNVYIQQKRLAEKNIASSELALQIAENDLRYQIRQAWYDMAYLLERRELLRYQDSIFQRFLRAAILRHETEASSYLERAAAETEVMKIANDLELLNADFIIAEREMITLLNDSIERQFNPLPLNVRNLESIKEAPILAENPNLMAAYQNLEVAEAERKVANAKMWPDFTVGYSNLSLAGAPLPNGEVADISDRFGMIHGGVAIPLFFGSYKAEVEVAELKAKQAKIQASFYAHTLENQFKKQLQEIIKYQSSMRYYEEKALPHADLIILNAQRSFENGAINYIEFFANMILALGIKYEYLETLNNYNQAVIKLEYLLGQ